MGGGSSLHVRTRLIALTPLTLQCVIDSDSAWIRLDPFQIGLFATATAGDVGACTVSGTEHVGGTGFLGAPEVGYVLRAAF